ncbi:hypothetical protein BV25DRAFT_1843633, partial [Artomyces pyxidatus]
MTSLQETGLLTFTGLPASTPRGDCVVVMWIGWPGKVVKEARKAATHGLNQAPTNATTCILHISAPPRSYKVTGEGLCSTARIRPSVEQDVLLTVSLEKGEKRTNFEYHRRLPSEQQRESLRKACHDDKRDGSDIAMSMIDPWPFRDGDGDSDRHYASS